MIIKANEIQKYMQMHNVDKIPVEVIDTEVPANKDLQKARKLAKRLVITNAKAGKFGTFYKHEGVEAVQIKYAMYNSFKKSQCYVPPEWGFEVLANDLGKKMLNEYNEHGGNLEKKFRETYDKINPEIQEKIAAACKLIDEAEALSEKHGIPFEPSKEIPGGVLSYMPQSFESIFGDLLNDPNVDEDIIYDVTGVSRGDGDYGWMTSSMTC